MTKLRGSNQRNSKVASVFLKTGLGLHYNATKTGFTVYIHGGVYGRLIGLRLSTTRQTEPFSIKTMSKIDDDQLVCLRLSISPFGLPCVSQYLIRVGGHSDSRVIFIRDGHAYFRVHMYTLSIKAPTALSASAQICGFGICRRVLG